MYNLRMNDRDIMRIAAEAGCDPRTVARAYDGQPYNSRKLSRSRIEEAARKLKLEPPPKPTLPTPKAQP